LLKGFNLDNVKLEVAIKAVRGSQKVTDHAPESRYETLQKFGQDLTEQAKLGTLDPVIGRDEEIRRVVQVLSRRSKNNPVLIGEPGVGKTAIAEGLAQRIVNGDVPESLKGRQLISLDMGSLVAGVKTGENLNLASDPSSGKSLSRTVKLFYLLMNSTPLSALVRHRVNGCREFA
jgi:ATP-dependent Clp protease ATP-binding subunit ClpB